MGEAQLCGLTPDARPETGHTRHACSLFIQARRPICGVVTTALSQRQATLLGQKTIRPLTNNHTLKTLTRPIDMMTNKPTPRPTTPIPRQQLPGEDRPTKSRTARSTSQNKATSDGDRARVEDTAIDVDSVITSITWVSNTASSRAVNKASGAGLVAAVCKKLLVTAVKVEGIKSHSVFRDWCGPIEVRG